MSKAVGTVLCAMSGGVDSSVAARLLLQQGYKVIGATMKIWSREQKACEKSCCGTDAVEDAKRVAGILDIPFVVLDMEDLFRETVIGNFISEYQSGRTPNPCIVCNTQLKFGYLRQKAAEFGADFVATGHYARIEKHNNRYALLRGLDESKDQSYFLYNLNQEQLGQILFPVGGFTKPEIRKMAAENGLSRVAEKAESQDICFIDRDHRDFLRANIPLEKQIPGPILDLQGKQLGRHEGLCFYTVGQRKGLGLSLPEPVYVLSMDYEKNTICVGPKEALQRKSFQVRDLVWVSMGEPLEPFRAKVKIRYQHKMADALISLSGGIADIDFEVPQSGIAAGQSAVFYDEQEQMVLGGGLII
jgi:tRNA-specific 2-thiouridylase